jgi:hypothetical protein
MAEPIGKLQLRCLQVLWRKKMTLAGIPPASDDARAMRHQYIAAVSDGRAWQTAELTHDDARRVISTLARELSAPLARDAASARAAGTHGRRGYDDGRTTALAGEGERRVIAALQRKLGWDEARLAAFVARQLRGRALTTVADANRVIWPMRRLARAAAAAAPVGPLQSADGNRCK